MSKVNDLAGQTFGRLLLYRAANSLGRTPFSQGQKSEDENLIQRTIEYAGPLKCRLVQFSVRDNDGRNTKSNYTTFVHSHGNQ